MMTSKLDGLKITAWPSLDSRDTHYVLECENPYWLGNVACEICDCFFDAVDERGGWPYVGASVYPGRQYANDPAHTNLLLQVEWAGAEDELIALLESIVEESKGWGNSND